MCASALHVGPMLLVQILVDQSLAEESQETTSLHGYQLLRLRTHAIDAQHRDVYWSLKSTALTALTPSPDAHVTRTRAEAVAGPVTTQLNVPAASPVFNTFGASVSHVAPPLRVSSIRTDSNAPRLCDHLMVFDCPIVHLTFVT